MPRYFIDTDDGDLSVQDEEGYELPDLRAARDAAHRALPDMARQKMPDGDSREFCARVRDENGNILYTVRLSLRGEWHEKPSIS